MRKLSIIFLLVALCGCHTKKNISSTNQNDTNTIATSDIRVSASKLNSALSSMAIELDSFVITAEPIAITPCPDSASNRSAVIAYRYHIKANSATVKGEKIAVSRASADTLQHDSIASKLVHSSATSEHCDMVSVYKPPDTTWVLLLLGLIIIVLIVIRKHFS